MNSGDLDATNRHITRRSFLGTTASGSAVLLTGGLATLFESAASAAEITGDRVEASGIVEQ